MIVDCTPAGNENKEKFYENLTGPKGFLAQGSEFGFGKPYARGINDEVLVPGEDRFLQIVSCNTHNITTLIKTIAHQDGAYGLRKGTFVCMRRSNDISQVGRLRAGPERRQARRPGLRHPPRPRRPSRLRDPGPRPQPLLERGQAQHPVHALDLVQPRAQGRHHARGGQAAAAGEPAGGGDRQALRQPDLQLRPRPRLLRPHPVADGGGDADPGGAQEARGLRLLLHAAGRQLAALLGGGRPLADRAGLEERARAACSRSAAGCTGRSDRRPERRLAGLPRLHATRRAAFR